MSDPWWFVEDGFEKWCDRHPRYMEVDRIIRARFLMFVFLTIVLGALTGMVIKWMVFLA